MVAIAHGLIVIAFYCGLTLVSRLGLTSSALTVWDLAALRFGVGGLLLLPLLARWRLKGIGPANAVMLSLLGGLGFALMAYVGFALAPAAHGAVLVHGSLPLFTALLAKRWGTARQVTGLLLIGAGIALMTVEGLSVADLSQLLGDLSLLAASLSWSTYGVLATRLQVNPAHVAAVVAGFSAAMYLPLYSVLAFHPLDGVRLEDLSLQIVVQGVLLGAGSIFVYTRALAALGAIRLSFFAAAVPALTTAIAVPLLDEWPSAFTCIGVLINTAGLVVSIAPSRPLKRLVVMARLRRLVGAR